jgi:hypothetical protein
MNRFRRNKKDSIYGNKFEGLNAPKKSLGKRMNNSLKRIFGKTKYTQQNPFANMPSSMRGGKRKRRKTQRKPKRTRRTKRRTRKSRR